MLDAVRSFFLRAMDPGADRESDADDVGREGAASGRERARLAACALLVEIAYADDEFTEEERVHLRRAVRRQFGLDEEEADELLALAERETDEAVDLFQFTRLVNRSFTHAQKVVLAEVMWGLVYSDGTLARREDYLVRKISNLLDLAPGFLSEARRRVREGEEDGDEDGDGGGAPDRT